MALTKADKEWVGEQIQTALTPLRSRGWRRAFYWLREWGILGVVITVFVALIAIAATLGVSAFNRVEDNAKFRQRTEDRLTGIEASIAALRIAQASSNPERRGNQVEAREVLATARKSSLLIPPTVVEQAGDRFIEASSTDPGAWGVALDFVAYRSSLNAPSAPFDRNSAIPLTMNQVTHYNLHSLPDKPQPSMQWLPPMVPREQAARCDGIGEDQNANLVLQPSWLLITGGTTSLDEMHIRNAVFQNVQIHYSGEALILENVVFINCAFVLDNNNPGRSLSKSLLASGRVTFRQTG